jgi:hypothetical protein
LSVRRQTQANNFSLMDGARRNYLTQPSVSLRQAAFWRRMSKKVSTATSSSASNLVARLEAIRVEQQLKCRGRRIPIQLIADALIKGGYNSLDDQAKALGLNRSTVWNIMKTKHKLGRLNNKTVRSILANTDTPPSVLVIIRSMLD